jgi:hypothetical protein
MRRKLVFGGDEVELIVVHTTAAFETSPRLALICNKPIQAGAQKRLEAGFGCIVAGKVVLLECVREESLRQIFRVFVIRLPLETNVFVSWFPIAREDGVERALAQELVIAAGTRKGGVVGDRKLVKRSANVSVWIYLVNPVLRLWCEVFPLRSLRISAGSASNAVNAENAELRRVPQR